MVNPTKPSRFCESLPGAQIIHIMLDLETAASGYRTQSPAIIEIAAVHFNLSTGQTYGEFHQNVNLKSCIERGLIAEKDPKDMTPSEKAAVSNYELKDNTIEWLKEKIPETYEKSLSEHTSTPLPVALQKFTNWVEDLTEASDRKNVRVWSKPSVLDFTWITNAFSACNLPVPWGRQAPKCCDTIINECHWTTGVKYSDEPPGNETFIGKKHYAPDDCKHQVRMLVKASKLRREDTGKPVLDSVSTMSSVQVGDTRLNDTATSALNSLLEAFRAFVVQALGGAQVSGTAVTAMNTLLQVFCVFTKQAPETFEALGFCGPTTFREVESTLERLAKLSRPPPAIPNLKRERMSPGTDNERTKSNSDKESAPQQQQPKKQRISPETDNKRATSTPHEYKAPDEGKGSITSISALPEENAFPREQILEDSSHLSLPKTNSSRKQHTQPSSMNYQQESVSRPGAKRANVSLTSQRNGYVHTVPGHQQVPTAQQLQSEAVGNITANGAAVSRILPTSHLGKADATEEGSDYGDDSDLDEFFHSFSA